MYKISASLRQRLLSQIYPIHSDWSRTTAFVLPTSYTGMIRVNLKGREPLGIVETGQEYESLLDQIENDLHALTDPLSGEPPIEKIYRPSRMFHTGPPEILPDLIVKFKSTKRYQEQLIHPRRIIRSRKPKYFRSNNHTEYGFFSGCGPDLKQKSLTGLSITDFAPMFLSQLGR
jgi:predicted AlkP superfamily phosphohydrolase/phosphomutase